jgi:predicted Zn-dependent protease
VDFLKSDDQLAFILSHEMGHNVMRHIDKQKDNAQWGAVFGSIGDVAAGMARVNSKGKFSKTGMGAGVLGYSEKFEAEADYVGLYIMARAGYNIDAAPDVWRIMSQAEPNSIYVHLTHPNNPARTIAMTKTVAEIHAKQRAHQPLIPNIQA